MILLFLNKDITNIEFADLLDISANTVSNDNNKYLNEGLDVDLHNKSHSGQLRKYDARKKLK